MFRAPRPASLPGFGQIVADLPTTQRQMARHLDITERTLQRYAATDSAPRAVVLALFWETRWGRSAADAEAANWAAMHYRRAEMAERQAAALRRQCITLEQALVERHGAANSPIWIKA